MAVSQGAHIAQAGDPAIDPSKYVFDKNNPANDYLIAKANKTGTDWFHEIFSPAFQQSHTVSASGGSDKNEYFFSMNYLRPARYYEGYFSKKVCSTCEYCI